MPLALRQCEAVVIQRAKWLQPMCAEERTHRHLWPCALPECSLRGITQCPTYLHHHSRPPVQSMLGPEASSDQFAALAGDATVAGIKAGRGNRQGSRGGAATSAGEQTAGLASSEASETALPRAKAQAAKPKGASDASAASADAEPDLPEVEEAQNPDSLSAGVDRLGPGKRAAGVDPAGNAAHGALQAAATTGDYGDELTAGRTAE